MPPKPVQSGKGQTSLFSFFNKPKTTAAATSSDTGTPSNDVPAVDTTTSAETLATTPLKQLVQLPAKAVSQNIARTNSGIAMEVEDQDKKEDSAGKKRANPATGATTDS
jgi:hypothetical protein